MSSNVVSELKTKVVVLGGGPGGYTAAFRLADLGKDCVLVEKTALGGVCLNVGCIPSKALLHVAKVLNEAAHLEACGIQFTKPSIDLAKLVAWKESVVRRLKTGIEGLAKQRRVTVLTGEGFFETPNSLMVKGAAGDTRIQFEQAVIAVGSTPTVLPLMPLDPRVMDSTGALTLSDIPKRLLIIGGGIIGLEMATVYQALGSQITVVELSDSLLPGTDPDLVAPLQKRLSKQLEKIRLKTRVCQVLSKPDGLWVRFEGEQASIELERFDRILVAVGRKSNGGLIDAPKAGVEVDERGFIQVDKQQKTNAPHIFAIGDVVGNPMLAHKSVAQAKIAAEVIAGLNHYFEPLSIPAVAYTDPEVAWFGLTELEAAAQGIVYQKAVFPWMASGRALSMGREEGLTKLLIDPKTKRIMGAGLVGVQAGDLIAEVALAVEMGAEAQDIALTIHAHPTLSETVALAAELFEGTITDLLPPKKAEH